MSNAPKYKTNDSGLLKVMEQYAVSVTDDVMALINHDDPNDPIAAQYLPSTKELVTTPEERADPIGDDAHSPVKGIVHRYPDRVLLKPVHVCAVYCRFCFRREMVGPGSEMLSPVELGAALDYIRQTPEIFEVILTGGDPLILSPRRLRDIMEALNAIEHVKAIRFHTRIPVADPSRVTDDVVSALESDKGVYIVYHTNHARELTAAVKEAARKFQRAGIPLLSQSVLLRGVNDDEKTLEELFRALVAMRIKPYYLHHPDLAPGTSHFRLTINEGRAIVKKLWGRMSGIAQPNYVLDIPGGFGKMPLADSWTDNAAGETHKVTDYQGKTHVYPAKKD